jgi:tRNA/rRNA methyltransferase
LNSFFFYLASLIPAFDHSFINKKEMKLHFILVEPAVAENIGAAARAVKTMGFSSLVLVNPSNFPSEKANWLAHGSADILRRATVFDSLQEASKHFDLIVGTTAKKRRVKTDYHSPDHLLQILMDKGDSVGHTALVFGREESGLTNEELSLCHLVSSIPMKAPYPSLNLAQAVMVYAYVLSPLVLTGTQQPVTVPGKDSLAVLRQKVDDILDRTDLKKNNTLYNRIMERLDHLDEDDVHLMHSVCNRISVKLLKDPKS